MGGFWSRAAGALANCKLAAAGAAWGAGRGCTLCAEKTSATVWQVWHAEQASQSPRAVAVCSVRGEARGTGACASFRVGGVLAACPLCPMWPAQSSKACSVCVCVCNGGVMPWCDPAAMASLMPPRSGSKSTRRISTKKRMVQMIRALTTLVLVKGQNPGAESMDSQSFCCLVEPHLRPRARCWGVTGCSWLGCFLAKVLKALTLQRLVSPPRA